MNHYKKLFTDYLDSKSIVYTHRDENSLVVKFQGRKTDFIEVTVSYPENGENVVSLRCWSVAHIAANRQKALEICNKLNDTYGFARAAVNAEGDVCIAADGYFDERTCGVMSYKLLKAILAYADCAYVEFSKI